MKYKIGDWVTISINKSGEDPIDDFYLKFLNLIGRITKAADEGYYITFVDTKIKHKTNPPGSYYFTDDEFKHAHEMKLELLNE